MLYVTGACLPGPTHCYTRIMDTVLPLRKPNPEDPPPMPTWYPEDATDPLPEEYLDEDLYDFNDPTITYEEDTKIAKKS